MEKIFEIAKEIRDLRETRPVEHLPIRTMKLTEEVGEVSAALVSVLTGSYKKLTYEDVLEEIIDTWIVSTDMMFTQFPGLEDISDEEREKIIVSIMRKKMDKWKTKINEGADNS